MTDNEQPVKKDGGKSSIIVKGICVAVAALAIGTFRHVGEFVRPLFKTATSEVSRIAVTGAEHQGSKLSSFMKEEGRVLPYAAARSVRTALEDNSNRSNPSSFDASKTQSDYFAKVSPVLPANKVAMNAAMIITEYYEKYKNTGDNTYDVVKSRSKTLTTASINGQSVGEPTEEIDESLPNNAKGEFARIQFVANAESDLKIKEGSRYVSDDGGYYEMSTEADVVIVSGSLAKYKAGETISLRYTRQGNAKLEDYYKKVLEKTSAADIKRSLESESKGIDKYFVKCNATIVEFPVYFIDLNNEYAEIKADGRLGVNISADVIRLSN